MLRSEFTKAFGNSKNVFQGIYVKAIFKGVTYESLSYPKFMSIRRAIPLMGSRHDEFNAAKADTQTE